MAETQSQSVREKKGNKKIVTLKQKYLEIYGWNEYYNKHKNIFFLNLQMKETN